MPIGGICLTIFSEIKPYHLKSQVKYPTDNLFVFAAHSDKEGFHIIRFLSSVFKSEESLFSFDKFKILLSE